MTDPNQQINPDPAVLNSEVAFGGADAVEKTTYVAGKGTDPHAERINTVAPAGLTGTNVIFWAILFIAAVVAAMYVLPVLGNK